jgi:hypothetical protein
MKLTTIIFLVISVSVFGQQNIIQTDYLSISGRLELKGNDRVSKNRLGLVTSIRHKDSIETRPFDIADDGQFKIDKLNSGTYRLTFRVNNDYVTIDTVVTISSESLSELQLKLFKKPCDYDALRDINDSKLKILISSGTSPRINNKGDNAFERKFEIKYVVLGDSGPESWNCLEKYNDTVYEFLDKKYGKRWRKTVRDDAIGLK